MTARTANPATWAAAVGIAARRVVATERDLVAVERRHADAVEWDNGYRNAEVELAVARARSAREQLASLGRAIGGQS